MVWRVCRDTLRESNDADDAFQATFLVLARRAGLIRKRSSVAPWLYGVALRVARCARRQAARRRDREKLGAGKDVEEPVGDTDRLDAAPILHEEVGRLPEKYRSPLVLCYFEGLTHEQAASQLGWPVGTVRSRLAVARDRLRPRLVRRGVAPSVAILAATSSAEAVSSLPAALASATVGMAMRVGAAGAVPAAVATLVGSTLRGMTMTKLSMIATTLVATAVVGTAGVGLVAARPQDTGKAAVPRPDRPPVQDGVDFGKSALPVRDLRRDVPTVPAPQAWNSPRVLWTRLTASAESFHMLEKLFLKGEVEMARVLAARGDVEALGAELETRADDLRDEVDLLEAQLAIRKAGLDTAEAHVAQATENKQIQEKLVKQHAISESEFRETKHDLSIRTAERAKSAAEVDEIKLRIKQAIRRRDEAADFVKRAKELPARPDGSAPVPAPAK
jgi:RNA polymerase sigma factor (sigma-70 family)